MITRAGGGIYLDVYVQPRARKGAIVGWHGEALKVAVTASPVRGRANEELLSTIARVLGTRRGDITLVKGRSGRRKRLFIDGVSEEAARRRIEEALG